MLFFKLFKTIPGLHRSSVVLHKRRKYGNRSITGIFDTGKNKLIAGIKKKTADSSKLLGQLHVHVRDLNKQIFMRIQN
jgi:hypothetical protein